jgi:pimeloyl-ACP methyl ester carboxylesterase
MKRAYADTPEGQIHYRIDGSGEPVIFLHMACSSSDEYTEVMRFMSNSYRCIAMDFPGYGDSDKPTYKYQIGDYARTVAEFMDALDIKRASIVGHHVGATIGAEFAVNFSDRVDKLILSAYEYFRDENKWIALQRDPVFKPIEINPEGSHLMEYWRRAKRYGDPVEIVARRALDFHKAGPGGEQMHSALHHAYGPKIKATLPRIQCPTLLLWGALDPFCEEPEDAKNLIPRSKLTIIPNGPVYIDRVMPKQFAEAIVAFLKNPGV